MIPPKRSAKFVAKMEDVLAVYERPYDPDTPVVCMDEQPVQLIRETRRPLPTRKGSPLCVDFEYERAGTASIFLFTEALRGWRAAHVRQRRSAVDFAAEIAWLLDDVYPGRSKVIVVCDNLNTHALSSLYRAFKPEKARELARRLEIHYTPEHGSWLNIAECELSALSRQALAGRIGEMDELRRRTADWEHERNGRQVGVNWQFTNQDARTKLKRLYPEIQSS